MALEINKPSAENRRNEKAKLSPFGKKIVVLGVVAAVILTVVGVVGIFTGRQRAAKEGNVTHAVARAVAVCEAGMASVNDKATLAEFESYIQRIDAAKSVRTKADLAVEMIGFVGSHAGDDSALIDELNGARNRIFAALKDL